MISRIAFLWWLVRLESFISKTWASCLHQGDTLLTLLPSYTSDPQWSFVIRLLMICVSDSHIFPSKDLPKRSSPPVPYACGNPWFALTFLFVILLSAVANCLVMKWWKPRTLPWRSRTFTLHLVMYRYTSQYFLKFSLWSQMSGTHSCRKERKHWSFMRLRYSDSTIRTLQTISTDTLLTRIGI